MHALGSALFWGVIAALVMGAGGLFLRHDFAVQLASYEERAAARGASSEQDVSRMRDELTLRQLEGVCARDVLLERLALELAAGGHDPDELARAANTFADALAGSVVLLEQARGLTTLAVSKGAPALSLGRSELESASRGQLLARDRAGKSWHVLSCRRPHGRGALWLALVEPEPELAAASKPPPESAGLALAFVIVAAFLLASTVAYLMAARAERHEQALATIERAAERVAQGDLVSAIDVRVDHRADRTFRTFDRMTKELRDMRVRLAEAEREAAFREVARRIAHEIKNPLSPIQTAIETLRKAHQKARPDFPEIFDESTRAILEEVKRMERIVREFGEFARLPKPEPGAIDLAALVRDVVPLYVPEGAELELELSDGAARVRADREQITQVLVNLVKNALDAAHDRSPQRVRIAVETAPGGTCFAVADNGPGIALADRERVFEPYYTTKDEGTGLGLAIVKRIVVDHGGHIEVEKSPLGGASVRVTLPPYEP
jgi:two-component system nitrogen regulation sensor histidine kinase NtrY